MLYKLLIPGKLDRAARPDGDRAAPPEGGAERAQAGRCERAARDPRPQLRILVLEERRIPELKSE